LGQQQHVAIDNTGYLNDLEGLSTGTTAFKLFHMCQFRWRCEANHYCTNGGNQVSPSRSETSRSGLTGRPSESLAHCFKFELLE
jgi:hypothetical protein